MRIIPVIDLQKGIVVRGVAGHRDHYQPVCSVLAGNAGPYTVARTMVQATGARELYVADLDAIAGAEPDWGAYHQIARAGTQLLIDAGLRRPEDARPIVEFASANPCVAGIIAALESSGSPEQLADVFACLGDERAVFSLDMKDGSPMSSEPAWAGLSAEQIADVAVEIGFRRMIVLDISRVGMGHGPATLPLCGKLREKHPHLELVTGGGIRNGGDLERASRGDCDAVLVASALHDGSLTPEDLRGVLGNLDATH